jgi:hypothetical protein
MCCDRERERERVERGNEKIAIFGVSNLLPRDVYQNDVEFIHWYL